MEGNDTTTEIQKRILVLVTWNLRTQRTRKLMQFPTLSTHPCPELGWTNMFGQKSERQLETHFRSLWGWDQSLVIPPKFQVPTRFGWILNARNWRCWPANCLHANCRVSPDWATSPCEPQRPKINQFTVWRKGGLSDFQFGLWAVTLVWKMIVCLSWDAEVPLECRVLRS